MDMNQVVKSLLSVTESDSTILTLTLDLAGTGTLPQATRVFLMLVPRAVNECDEDGIVD